jgi:hypothetical protein
LLLLLHVLFSLASLVQAQSRPAQMGSAATVAAPIPLAAHPQGQQMMARAAQNAALLDINFQFLNKTYENDQYVNVAGQRVRTSCLRFKATSGFRFKMDVPKYTLNGQGLTLEQNISKISADGLAVKVQVGPCTDISTGVGVRLSDVKLIYKAKPMLTFDQNNNCKLSWSQGNDDLNISIGDLNILGVQNNIDKLAKDAAREALNASLDAYFSSKLRGELMKVTVNVCGSSKAKTR